MGRGDLAKLAESCSELLLRCKLFNSVEGYLLERRGVLILTVGIVIFSFNYNKETG